MIHSTRAMAVLLPLMSMQFLPIAVPEAKAQSTIIVISGTSAGRAFDGVGGLSGGGGTSRLLWDYPAQQRDEILDYLFLPHYGASLQILKVEIGSDANSTNGAEASHMRSRTDSNFTRGYEWWLMEQAKARNPNIKLYGLEWGAPGWFSGGFWSQDNINYIISWIKHAQSDHHCHIDFIGGWNESGWDKTWYENLKAALLNNGLTTKVVAADNGWNIAGDLSSDAAFKAAVDIMGVHYPCGYISGEQNCTDNTYTSTAEGLGIPVWGSESGSQNYDAGATALARVLNRGYIDSKMTAYINWSLVAAWYRTLPYYGCGLMLADQPWSGSYYVAKSIWVMAHTAQFTDIGWHYVDISCGYLGGVRTNGSYVTLKSPNGKDYSTIIETMDATTPQAINVAVVGGLSTDTVHVWASNVNSPNPNDFFVHVSDILPVGGRFTDTLQPGFVYTISTTTGQAKGSTSPPPPSTMSLPYTENFEKYSLGAIPSYFDAIQGAFEVDSCHGGRTGLCMRQMITLTPIEWPGGSPTPPLAVVGDPGWSNYSVSTDALLEQTGYVDLIGRLGAQSQSYPGASQGYHLRVASNGAWSLFKETAGGVDTQLGAGTATMGLNSWHNLTLSFNADTVQAFVDSVLATSVNDGTYASGQVGLLVSKWQQAEFDNFFVHATAGSDWTTIDDAMMGSGFDFFSYVGSGWSHCTGCGADLYDQTNSWDNTTDDEAAVEFNGTQIRFYGVEDPGHGIGAISIDGGSETLVDFYAATRMGNQLMWTSSVLPPGDHLFKIRVTGTKNASSTNSWVVPDRVDIRQSGIATVQQTSSRERGYSLRQNFPNPFNPTTVISYRLPIAAQVTLRIYDVLGREVETLVNSHQHAGEYSVTLDAAHLSSGIYYYRLQTEGFTETKQLVLIK